MATSDLAPTTPAVTDRRKAPVKPDQEAYDKELATINANIEALKVKHTAAQGKINGTDNIKGSFDSRRKELREKLDELNKERNELQERRGKILDQLKTGQAGLKKKGDEVRNSKDRLGYKSAEEVDKAINDLEHQLQLGQAKLIEEKRIVAEISNLKKAKKILEGFSSSQSSTESEKAKLDDLRSQLNAIDPQRNAVREKIDAVRAQLNELDGERKEQMGSFTDLVNERKAVKASLDAEFDKLRTLRTDFKKQKDEWYQWQNEERNRKRDQYKAQRQAEIEAKLTAQAQREREAAEVPAYSDEINEVNALIKYLKGWSGEKEEVKEGGVKANANIRQVDNSLPEGAVALGKKSDREEESFLMLGGGKKGRKGPKRTESLAPAAGKPKAFKLDFETISQFMKLKIDIPVSAADVPTTVSALEEKKKWFEDNQKEQTKKNVEAAEKKIEELKAKAAAGDAALDAKAEEEKVEA
ncbi:hypothetical protein HK097_000407 [Rhizophlyctis rosea]|uniref:Nuclear segregation protein Bfr1 n=1 Tax=Rhizophlyctis rosea TaxID=64517 RepID=A0AAD5S801_9FUNG|nr:hypothetical protein HK097_000407 [Rhizophlyctis rosea]